MGNPSEAIDLAAMKKQAEAMVKAADEASASEPAGKITPREITLQVRYPEPGTGKMLRANLTSRIMTGDERRVATRLEVQLAGGVAVTSMSGLAQNRLRALAVCTVQLRDPDEWVPKYLAEDDTLLYSIYGALEEHDSRYFFRDLRSSEGGTEARRLAVVTPFDAESGEE